MKAQNIKIALLAGVLSAPLCLSNCTIMELAEEEGGFVRNPHRFANAQMASLSRQNSALAEGTSGPATIESPLVPEIGIIPAGGSGGGGFSGGGGVLPGGGGIGASSGAAFQGSGASGGGGVGVQIPGINLP